VEGPRASDGAALVTAAALETPLASTRTATSENFPVASIFLRPAHRAVILAFYRFARTADDIADDTSIPAPDQRARLESMRATLAGEADCDPCALAVRSELAGRKLSPIHAIELLHAFTQDTQKTRYTDWADLMEYCRYSAAPVGRFVLDVHGESQSLWPHSDALCAALQVINHMQDCREDLRTMNRAYMPLADLAAAGARVEDMDAATAAPALRTALAAIAKRTQCLLEQARPFAEGIKDRRLGAEVAIIQRLAEDLNAMLLHRDPLSERVRHGRLQSGAIALATFVSFSLRRRS
jgi:hydroxysqualene synthase